MTIDEQVVRRDSDHGGSMRVKIDWGLCDGNGACMFEAPEVFEVRDDDNLYVLQEEPPEELRPRVQAAVTACPKQAIAIED
jgi:ferredoxin